MSASDVAALWMQLRSTPDLVAAAVEAEGSPLAIQTTLRRRFPTELVPLAMQLREVRRLAAAKFENANCIWSDRVGLEQATHGVVARYKATRFPDNVAVTDLCCGMGADTAALLATRPVHAVDLRPEALLFTQWNAETFGVPGKLTTTEEDVTAREWPGLVHLDPDRRPDGRRVRRLEEYQPGLKYLQTVASGEGGAIKLSPAANFGGKFFGCETELISLDGECREATIWFGSLADGEPSRATVLRTNGMFATIAGDPLDSIAEVAPLGELLFDPDPAVVRAGLVDQLCVQCGLERLDDAEEYLTASDLSMQNEEALAPFATGFRVLDACLAKPKPIRKMLDGHRIGPLEVKTRHVSIDANAMQRKFQRDRGDDREPGVLFYLRLNGKTAAVLARRRFD